MAIDNEKLKKKLLALPSAEKIKGRFKAESIPLEADFQDLIEIADLGRRVIGLSSKPDENAATKGVQASDGPSGPGAGLEIDANGLLAVSLTSGGGLKADKSGGININPIDYFRLMSESVIDLNAYVGWGDDQTYVKFSDYKKIDDGKHINVVDVWGEGGIRRSSTDNLGGVYFHVPYFTDGFVNKSIRVQAGNRGQLPVDQEGIDVRSIFFGDLDILVEGVGERIKFLKLTFCFILSSEAADYDNKILRVTLNICR